MQKHGNVVFTLAMTCHFYWTYASLMISFYLHEQLWKQWLSLDDLVHKLHNIGLQVNTRKTVVLTSIVQPPSFLHTHERSKNECFGNKGE